MAIAIDDLRRRINVDEPDYEKLAGALGPSVVPLLNTLVDDPSPAVASKATSLLSRFSEPEALAGLEKAAQNADPNVRVAAAAGLRNLGSPPQKLTQLLLGDPDAGVRKVTLQSVSKAGFKAALPDIERVANADPIEALRAVAQKVAGELRLR